MAGVSLWRFPDRLLYEKGWSGVSDGGEGLYAGTGGRWIFSGCSHKAGSEASAGAGTGKPAWIPLCCSVCDPDGGSKRSATQCGDAAGVWNGLGGSRGGRCPCHIFAMCGGL